MPSRHTQQLVESCCRVAVRHNSINLWTYMLYYSWYYSVKTEELILKCSNETIIIYEKISHSLVSVLYGANWRVLCKFIVIFNDRLFNKTVKFEEWQQKFDAHLRSSRDRPGSDESPEHVHKSKPDIHSYVSRGKWAVSQIYPWCSANRQNIVTNTAWL